MKTFVVHFKRAGRHRDFRRIIEAKDIQYLEDPIKMDLEGIVPGIEQATITISEAADDEGGRAGQINYGLNGEFTVYPA